MSITAVLNDNQIRVVEQYYNAAYLLDSCLKNKNGSWVDWPVSIFYTKEKHPKGSNYLGVYYDINGRAMVTDAISATLPFEGLLLIDDTILYSRYRHDFRQYEIDGKFIAIDGGRDYTKIVGDTNLIKERIQIMINDGKVITGRITQ